MNVRETIDRHFSNMQLPEWWHPLPGVPPIVIHEASLWGAEGSAIFVPQFNSPRFIDNHVIIIYT